MQQIDHENTCRTLAENANSEEEMSYSEMVSHVLGELVPGRGRVATCVALALLFLILTLALWSPFGWHFYRKNPDSGTHSGSVFPANKITSQKIRLLQRLPDGSLSSEIPSWIHEDLRETIFRRLQKDGNSLSIYEDTQIASLQNILKEVFWIRNVHAIRKFYPAFLEIEVTYRKPVVLVIVLKKNDAAAPAAGSESASNSEGSSLCYVPLSEDCRILPTDPEHFPVAPEKLDRFPVFCGDAPPHFYETEDFIDVPEFSGYDMPPSRMEGTPWDRDEAIRGAVELVNLIGDRWEKFGLSYLCMEERRSDDYDFGPEFCLVSINGSRIHWGRSLSRKRSKNDILNSEKLAQLEEIYQKNGPFDGAGNRVNVTFRHASQQEKQKTTPTETGIVESQTVGKQIPTAKEISE